MRLQIVHPMLGLACVVCVFQLFVCGQPACGQWIPNLDVQSPAPLEYKLAMKDAASSPIAVPRGFDPLPLEKPACEIYVPSRYRAEKPAGLILYLSPGPRSQAARPWKSTFERQQLLYASPHGIGNRVPVEHRVQTAIAVLHHMRSKYNIDPDRVYLVGFSGGARLALMIAFAYPEYFGGVVAIGSGGLLPKEPWMFDRIRDRLRVGLIIGRTDGFRREVEFQTYNLLNESKIATKLFVPSTKHVLPKARTLTDALKWLEEGLDERRELAAKFPATRIADTPDPEEWSERLLAEAKQRLAEPETIRSGVAMLSAVSERWPETKAAADAKEIYAKYDANNEGDWKTKQRELVEERLLADAKSMEALATDTLPFPSLEYVRANSLTNAIEGWRSIGILTKDSDLRETAKKKVQELSALAK